MKNYLRCAVANRANLSGFIILIMGLGGILFQENIFFYLMAAVGFLLMLLCKFGLGTLNIFQRTLEILEHEKEIESHWKEWSTWTYCNRAGFKLALKDWEKKTTHGK